MRVDYLVLADAATAAEGKLYIHGAGWDMLRAASFPVSHPQIAVAVRLRFSWNDTNQPHTVELDVVDADMNSILPTPPGPMTGSITAGRPPHISPGSDQVVPMVFNFLGIQFPKPGTYEIAMRIDGKEEVRSPFTVGPAASGMGVANGGLG